MVIKNIAYTPDRIEVPAGTEVVWVFGDGGVSHIVTADDESFDSDQADLGRVPVDLRHPGEVNVTARSTPACTAPWPSPPDRPVTDKFENSVTKSVGSLVVLCVRGM